MKNKILKLANIPSNLICKREYKRQSYVSYNERSIEYGFVFDCIAKLCPVNILDIGTGTTALPHLMRNCGPVVTAIDNITDYWPKGMTNRHWHVLNKDIAAHYPNIKGYFNMITCISVLEHVKNHDIAVYNMFKLLPIGGHLVLTFPYTEHEYRPNVYDLPESNARGRDIPFVCQSYSRHELDKWLNRNGGCIVFQRFYQCWTGEFWTTGSRVIPPQRVDKSEKHQLTCVLIKKLKSKQPIPYYGVLQ